MRSAGHQDFLSKSSGGLPRRVELGEGRVRRVGPDVAVWRINSRQMNSRSRHVRNMRLHVAEVVVDARRPAADVAVTEIPGDAGDRQQLHISRRESIQIFLKSG